VGPRDKRDIEPGGNIVRPRVKDKPESKAPRGKERHMDTKKGLMRDLQEELFWILQKKHPRSRVWLNASTLIKGKTEALRRLNESKETKRSWQWRVVSQPEADKYNEGIKAMRPPPMPRRPMRTRSPRLPMMYLPENL
jgi:hypothetical protein